MAAKRLCSVEGCGKLAHSRGWCSTHYSRWRIHGDHKVAITFPKAGSFVGRYPTRDELSRLLSYDPETGQFTWLARPEINNLVKAWNRRFAGKSAGRVNLRDGYIVVSIFDRIFLAHRLALIISGFDLSNSDGVDHANGNASDNRLSNLRLASNSQNQANQKKRERRRWPGAPKGVSPHKNGRYRAHITVRGQWMHLGYFDTAAEAHDAYMRAAKVHFREFARAK